MASTITLKEKSKQKTFRVWVAVKLVRLAQQIYPKSDAVKTFYTQLIIDEIIYGQSIVRIDPWEGRVKNEKS